MLAVPSRLGSLGQPGMSAVDRMPKGNEPDFDFDNADGYQGQLFVADVLDSMQDGARIEVKNDRLAHSTGNVFLEYACWISGQWVRSGVARQTSRSSELVTVVVATTVVITAPRDLLLRVAQDFPKRKGGRNGSNPTWGYVVPVGELVRRLMAAGITRSPCPPTGDGMA